MRAVLLWHNINKPYKLGLKNFTPYFSIVIYLVTIAALYHNVHFNSHYSDHVKSQVITVNLK